MKSIPHVISWNLTKACNLLCSHCYLLADNIQQLDQADTNLSGATPSQETLNFNQMQCGTASTADELNKFQWLQDTNIVTEDEANKLKNEYLSR